MINKIKEFIKSNGINVYSVCEVNGDGVHYEKFIPSNCHDSYSVAKAFMVTAAGLLYDDGLLDVDEYIYPVFKNEFPDNYDKTWETVKLSDVMLHRTGFDRSGLLDIDVDDVSAYGTKDYLKYLLSFRLKYKPGEKWVYTDAAFYLVSRFITAKCGEMADDLLNRRLFSHMDFSEFAFSKCPHGYPMGGTGLYISSRDMAKLGELYINRGVYNGQRLLSEAFVDTVINRGFELTSVDGKGAYGKGGYLGQMLYFNYRTGRVVAYHSCDATKGHLLLEFIKENDL